MKLQILFQNLSLMPSLTFYFPRQVFMTFGNIAAEKQQEKFSKLALSKITSVPEAEIKVFEETRYREPQKKIFEQKRQRSLAQRRKKGEREWAEI